MESAWNMFKCQKETVTNSFKCQTAEFFDDRIQKLVPRLDKCLNVYGDYVGKWENIYILVYDTIYVHKYGFWDSLQNLT